jgi:Protein of unknown function (DUF3311)
LRRFHELFDHCFALPDEPTSERYRQQAHGRASCNDGKMRRFWYLLLILPFVGTLIPPLFNHARPALFGMPFFYWYQLAWVLVTAALLGAVVALTRELDV